MMGHIEEPSSRGRLLEIIGIRSIGVGGRGCCEDVKIKKCDVLVMFVWRVYYVCVACVCIMFVWNMRGRNFILADSW